jgi:UDP-glucuronate 4-epimerase
MKILITGCCGFIGSNLCLYLLKTTSHFIVGVDRIPLNKVLKGFQKFQFIKMDISEIDLGLILDIDQIIHLAAIAGVRKSMKEPLLYLDNNLKNFVYLLEECRKNGVKKVVYASSSSVYGDNISIPFQESDRIDNLRSSYACSKRCMEVYAKYYHDVFEINTIGLRFFTVYGEMGRRDMAPYIFTRNIYEGKEIIQYGDGETMRDYTYVGDIISGIMSIIEGKGKHGEVYNLGNGNPIKLKDFIKIIEKVVGKKAIVKKEEMKKGDVMKTYASIEKAKLDLNYEPKINIKDGLKILFKWIKND